VGPKPQEVAPPPPPLPLPKKMFPPPPPAAGFPHIGQHRQDVFNHPGFVQGERGPFSVRLPKSGAGARLAVSFLGNFCAAPWTFSVRSCPTGGRSPSPPPWSQSPSFYLLLPVLAICGRWYRRFWLFGISRPGHGLVPKTWFPFGFRPPGALPEGGCHRFFGPSAFSPPVAGRIEGLFFLLCP